MTEEARPRVVVVGGGFAGLFATRALRRAPVSVTGIDPAARQVHAKRPLRQPLEFGYDYLIVAAGVEQSYFGHDEFGLFAPGMKSIADALTIRRRVFGAFEMAE